MTIEDTLKGMGLALPNPPAAAGNYVPTVQTGNLLYCAGTISAYNGELTHTGQVGREQTVQSGYDSARVCALATLTNIKAAVGSLERVRRIVFVSGYVNAINGFADSPAVVNGASDLFVALFGEAGRHARAAVGTPGQAQRETTRATSWLPMDQVGQ